MKRDQSLSPSKTAIITMTINDKPFIFLCVRGAVTSQCVDEMLRNLLHTDTSMLQCTSIELVFISTSGSELL